MKESTNYKKKYFYKKFQQNIIATSYFTKLRINKFLDSAFNIFNLSNKVFYIRLMNLFIPFFLMFVFANFLIATIITALNAFLSAIILELVSYFLKINHFSKILFIKRKHRKQILSMLISLILSMLFVILSIKNTKEISQFIIN